MNNLMTKKSIAFGASGLILLTAVSVFLYYNNSNSSNEFAIDSICGNPSDYNADPSGYEGDFTFDTISEAGFKSYRPALATDPAGNVEDRAACSIVFSTDGSSDGEWDSLLTVAILAQSDDDFKECENEDRSLNHRSDDSAQGYQTSDSDLTEWERETIAYDSRFSTSGQVRSSGLSEADVELNSCNSDLNIRIGAYHAPSGDDSKFGDDQILEFILELREHTLDAVNS